MYAASPYVTLSFGLLEGSVRTSIKGLTLAETITLCFVRRPLAKPLPGATSSVINYVSVALGVLAVCVRPFDIGLE
jgi:hypothetical protein